MLLDISYLQEFKFLLVLGLVIVGWQVSLLFIYKYFKLNDENVKLNRVILAYGILIFMGMFCLLFLTIITLFVPDPIVSELLRKSAYISALVAIAFFWYFVSIEQFNELVSIKITKVFLYLTFIPIILVFLMNTSSDEFRYSLILLLIEMVFLVIFQIKLIQNSRGTVKNRFILIFIAAIFIALSIMFGANTVLSVLSISTEVYDLLFYIGSFSMLIGIILLSISLYNFPPILEFTWKENLQKLVIFNQNDHSSLYSLDFIERSKKGRETNAKQDDINPLFSGGLAGIDSIISAITNTEGEKIKKIKQGNSYILLEYAEEIPITYAIVVKENLKSIRYFLSRVKKQFEAFYKDILLELDNLKGNTGQLFNSFEILINDLLTVM